MINLKLHKDYQISVIKFKKIDFQLIDPFGILKRINRLIYRFKLLNNMRIYDIIFVTYLKSIIDSIKDFYKRRYLTLSIIVINNQNKYHIKKLIYKRRIQRDRK